MTYTLIIISLVVLSTDEVKVQPLRTEIHGLSKELCLQQRCAQEALSL